MRKAALLAAVVLAACFTTTTSNAAAKKADPAVAAQQNTAKLMQAAVDPVWDDLESRRGGQEDCQEGRQEEKEGLIGFRFAVHLVRAPRGRGLTDKMESASVLRHRDTGSIFI